MTYEYRCPCGNTSIVERPMMAPGGPIEKQCRLCLRTTVHQQVYQPTAIQFKGTGFYATDSRNEFEQYQFRNLDRD